jgi:uncharacterized membrane protein
MMGIFSFFNKKNDFFTDEEKKQIVNAVSEAEKMTSGEIRVFIENRCSFMDAIDRTAELFFKLEMDETKERNAVLVYVAMKDKQLAIFGDEGIHKKLDSDYWNREVKKMISKFNKEDYAAGISEVITDIGEALTKNFPYNQQTDKNELPDKIIFGK